MSQHLQRDINSLKKRMLYYCTLIEENLTRAVTSLETHDKEKANRVILQEKQIDQLEIEIEEECLKVLVLHQPVAVDLRFVVAMLKINNDLERIDDMAVNIVKRFMSLDWEVGKDHFHKLTECAEKVRKILRHSLDSLIELDLEKAKSVLEMDTEIDQFHAAFFDEIKKLIQRNPDNIHTLMCLLSISKQLERVSDHATNIAEDVIYLIKGEIVRHSPYLDI